MMHNNFNNSFQRFDNYEQSNNLQGVDNYQQGNYYLGNYYQEEEMIEYVVIDNDKFRNIETRFPALRSKKFQVVLIAGIIIVVLAIGGIWISYGKYSNGGNYSKRYSKKDYLERYEDLLTDEEDINTSMDTSSKLSSQAGYKYYDDSSEKVVSNAIICSSTSEITTALGNAKAGDTIYIKGGNYNDYKFEIESQGSSDKYISIKNYPGEIPVFTSSQLKVEENSKYINIDGLTFKDFVGEEEFDYCIKVLGGCSYINIENVEIDSAICTDTANRGINPLLIYGDTDTPITNVNISNCYIHDCVTGYSEALTVEGNTENCVVQNCTVDNNGNIGIDIAGNFSYTGIVGDPDNQARNVMVTKCLIMNCNSPNATSAALYCDGGRNVTFSHNILYNSQCGIELGAEEPGADVHNFKVYNNLIVNCGRAMSAGAYLESGAKHYDSYVYNNTIVCKEENVYGDNYALYLERTSNFNFFNNIIYTNDSDTKFYGTQYDIDGLNISNNCWYTKGGNTSKPSVDSKGIYADPCFNSVGYTLDADFTLKDSSPCKDKGTALESDLSYKYDLKGNNRINSTIDMGAYEK